MSKTFKLFLASSGELSEEREEIKDLIDSYKHVFIEYKIEMWEDMSKSFKPNGIQEDTINPILKDCDVVILMFHSRVGKFTNEELDIALKGIKNNSSKPKYLLFYYTDKNSEKYKLDFNDINIMSENMKVMELVKQCKDEQQVPILFRSIEELKTKINHELKEIEKIEVKDLEASKSAPQKQEEDENTKLDIDLTIHSTLPPRDLKFVDREDDIKEIVGAIIDNQECLVYGINGMGGIGKSAIITEVCYIFKDTLNSEIKRDYLKEILGNKKYFKDGILWIKFEKDLSFEKHIENISKIINYKIDYSKDKESLKYLFEELFSKIDILIVLDSCEQNVENFKHFYGIFANIKPTLITSREKFDFVTYKKNLNTLNEEEARELFKQNASLAKDDDKIDVICKDVGYLPLAVIIVSKMADKYGLNKTIEKLSEKLGQKENILQDGKQKFICMEDVFELSFDLLDKKEKEILSIASIFNYSFKSETLKEITKSEDTEILYKLHNKSLIERNSYEDEYSYSFHPIIREFAQIKFSNLPNKDKYKEAKEIYFLNMVQSNKDILKKHIKEILTIIEECNNNSIYTRYVGELDIWLLDHGYWIDKEKLLKNAIKKTENKHKVNQFRSSLGDLYIRQSKYNEGKEEFNNALEYFNIDISIHGYLSVNYKLSEIEYKQDYYENNYKLNSEFARESMYLDSKRWNAAFCRTNGWIAKKYQKNNFTKSYLLISFAYITQYIKDSNAMFLFDDIIDYLFSIEEYQKAKNIILSIDKCYNHYEGFDSQKLSLINNKIECDELDIISDSKELDEIKNKYLDMGKESTISYIDYLRGRIALYQNDIKTAKVFFKNIDTEYDKNYWLGRCEIEDSKFDDAKKHLLKVKKYYESNQNVFSIASVDIYIGLLESKTNIDNASNILSKCKKIFEEFGFTPKEYYEVIEQIDDLKIDTSKITIEKTNFFLENLPTTLQFQDSKEMVLVEKGMSFYGKGNQEILTIDTIVDEIDEMFEDENYYKKYEDNIFLYDFYIDKECVTNQEYIDYCVSASIKVSSYLIGLNKEQLSEPATNKKLSIEDAKAYAKHYGKELPLPQEWEKAFRGEIGSLYFKESSHKDILTSYAEFEITDKHSFSGSENRYRNSSDKYKLTDSFSNKEASKQFIFRCVKPVFSMEDINN